jgi:biotin synthase
MGLNLSEIKNSVLNGKYITIKEAQYLASISDNHIPELTAYAFEIKKAFLGEEIDLCSIVNAKSGLCSEDCTFCAQSAHYNTDVSTYDFIDERTLLSNIGFCKSKGVKRFSIVTSGKTLDDKAFKKVLKGVKHIKDAGLIPDLSVGILSRNQLLALKEVGLEGYHHNLETSRSYFPNVCTTHKYDEDVQVVKDAIDLGFYVCSGCIFGIGESWNDRIELAFELKSLNVHSIPVNFLTPIKGTPLENKSILSENEALKIIAVYRFILPDKHIRICGGRNTVFSEITKKKLLTSGASGIMVGNYLTTSGFDIDSDLHDIQGLRINR